MLLRSATALDAVVWAICRSCWCSLPFDYLLVAVISIMVKKEERKEKSRRVEEDTRVCATVSVQPDLASNWPKCCVGLIWALLLMLLLFFFFLLLKCHLNCPPVTQHTAQLTVCCCWPRCSCWWPPPFCLGNVDDAAAVLGSRYSLTMTMTLPDDPEPLLLNVCWCWCCSSFTVAVLSIHSIKGHISALSFLSTFSSVLLASCCLWKQYRQSQHNRSGNRAFYSLCVCADVLA